MAKTGTGGNYWMGGVFLTLSTVGGVERGSQFTALSLFSLKKTAPDANKALDLRRRFCVF